MKLLFLTLAGAVLWGQVDEIRKEPDPLKRFDRAIDAADTLAKTARQLVKDGGSRTDLLAALTDCRAAVDLALKSLRDTGKKPSKLGKQYKKGELRTRELVRQLNDLVLALGIEDRPVAEQSRDHIQVVHEDFLLGIMNGK
jgi:hypothetical protein